ncbi:MAG: MarR family transcriptional regulator [Albidovulum sp.]
MLRTAAILTGDLIGSTAAGADGIAHAMQILARTATDVAKWPESGAAKFTRFRGDGWQVHIAPQHRALRAALIFGAALRAAPDALQTRIAIGTGPVESLGGDDLSDAHGAAFENSGRALDLMTRGQRLHLGGDDFTPLHWAVIGLIDERMSRWTPEQAEAIALALPPDAPTQAEIAAKIGISSQAMNYRLTGAGAGAIRRAVQAWEDQEASND